jgi:hypothetical protein
VGSDSFTFQVSDGTLSSNVATVSISVSQGAAAVLGDTRVEPAVDVSDDAGKAEAFRVVAPADGYVSSLSVYLAAGNAATTLVAGLYADAGGHPGMLLGRGSLSPVSAGDWNAVSLPNVQVSAGAAYWIALLGEGGALHFADRCCGAGGTGPSETSASLTLPDLPAGWVTGTVYHDAPVSAYATITPGQAATPPSPPLAPHLGTASLGSAIDDDAAGQAEAFQATAAAGGALTGLNVYVGATSQATSLTVGVYDDAAGHPGTLLGEGTIASPTTAAWNHVTLADVQLTEGAQYWIALLSPAGAGTVVFSDSPRSGHSETDAATALSDLPAQWTTGTTYADGNLAAYGP